MSDHKTPDAPRSGGPSAAPQSSAPVMRATAEERLQPPRPKPKPRHGVYAVAWAVLGATAAAYAGAVLVGQDSIGRIALRAQDGTSRAELAAAVTRTQTDVVQLQRSMGTLEADLKKLKAGAIQHDAREKELTDRVAVVETRVEKFANAFKEVPVATSQGKAAPLVAQAQALAKAQPKAAAAIETGALKAAEPQPPAAPIVAPPPAASQGSAAILLSRAPSVDALRLSWSLLNERHKGTLRTLEPRVAEADGGGAYDLLAGPFANPAEAMKACNALRARGVACTPADYRGDAL